MLELDSVLYVGGVPKDMYNALPVGVLSRQGFEGCMSSLDLPGESPSLIEDAVVPSSSLVSGCEGTYVQVFLCHRIAKLSDGSLGRKILRFPVVTILSLFLKYM